ncbi:putative membrane protein [Treponema paraluiscuniculi]|uniref:Membrane protein n=1 Tax=Treponema paraluiscuniculi TaxID=53435 RepID=A0ABY9E1V8_9SPIR|nr:putative membrane protein [Treponema paraluiscuniculi]
MFLSPKIGITGVYQFGSNGSSGGTSSGKGVSFDRLIGRVDLGLILVNGLTISASAESSLTNVFVRAQALIGYAVRVGGLRAIVSSGVNICGDSCATSEGESSTSSAWYSKLLYSVPLNLEVQYYLTSFAGVAVAASTAVGVRDLNFKEFTLPLSLTIGPTFRV